MKILLFLLIVGVPILLFSDGLLYPTVTLFPSKSLSLTVGTANLSLSAGISSKWQVGYALSYHDLGFYARYLVFQDTVIGMSYMPFTFCLFGTCDNVSFLNAYIVRTLKCGSELGFRMFDANGNIFFEPFGLLKKDVDGFLMTFEGGIHNVSNSWTGNFALSLVEPIRNFSFRLGLVWFDVKNVEDVAKVRFAFQVNATFEFGK